MRVVVTGGSGQLGTLVLRALARDRAVREIVSIDLAAPRVASKKIEAVRADVRDPAIGRFFEGAEVLVHLAALVTQAKGEIDAINVRGSRNVVEAAAKAGVKQIVVASSIAAYGVVASHVLPITEDAPRVRDPKLAYAASKFDLEADLDLFEAAHPEAAICRIRPGFLVGSRMEHALGKLLLGGGYADAGWSLPVAWDEDVAALIALAVKKRARGAFNAVATDPIDGRAFAEAARLSRVAFPRTAVVAAARLSRLAEERAPFDPAWLEIEPVPLAYDATRAARELGHKPRFATSRDVAVQLGAVAHRRVDPRIAAFMRLASLGVRHAAKPAAAGELPREARVHLELTGEGGGDWSLLVHEKELSIKVGAPRPPTSVVTMSARTFLELLAGRTTAATAQITSKIRIEGEPIGTLLVVGMVTTFRVALEKASLAPWPLSALARRLR